MTTPDDPFARRSVESTRWSLVLAAGRDDGDAGRAALARLCESYWPCVLAAVRRRVGDEHAAQDLTQEFFASLIERRLVARATPERGRFRAYLFTTLQHFLINAWEKSKARKRGGGVTPASLDALARGAAQAAAGGEDARETLDFAAPAPTQTPDAEFDRQWAVALLNQVLDRLAEEYSAGGRSELFETLKPTLIGDDAAATSEALGLRLKMSAVAVRAATTRMRKRYRDLLRETVAHTVADPSEVDDELRELFRVLSR